MPDDISLREQKSEIVAKFKRKIPNFKNLLWITAILAIAIIVIYFTLVGWVMWQTY